MNHTITLASIIPALTLGIAIIVIAIFAAIVFARTSSKKYGIYFLMTMIGIVLWSLGDIALLYNLDIPLWLLVATFFVGPMLIPIFIWFFAISFPENRTVPFTLWLIAISSTAVYTGLFLFNFDFFVTSINTYGVLNELNVNRIGYIVYAAFFSTYFLAVYATFLRKLKQLKGVDRTQVRYTFYGALISSVPAMFSNLTMPIIGISQYIWLGPLFSLVFAVAVSVAIVKHRLFDIRPVVVRTLGYALTIVTVSAVYGFIIFSLIRLVFNLQLSLVVQIVIAVSTGISALMFQSLKKSIDQATRTLFYRDAYDAQVLFDEYNKALVSTVDLEELLQQTCRIVVKYLKSDGCFIGVKDGSKHEYRVVGTDSRIFDRKDIQELRQITPKISHAVVVADDIPLEMTRLRHLLSSNNVAVLVRLTSDFSTPKEGAGYMVLGPKKSGNQYTSQDVQVIETMANELIIALQNALRFEEIERFNETLQRQVEDATRKLKASNLKLKKLNDTKDDFISMTSHQLRTPLTTIKGYVSLVMDEDAGPVNDAQRKLLTQAFGSAQRLVYMVADLLNVSRLKTGKFVIERTPTDLSTIIDDELGQLRAEASLRNLKLEYKMPKKFPILPLDETKTRQVIMNFLDNAIYYTPSGGKIRAELVEKDDSVEFLVIDNGIGVPKEERHHLFSKFYRAKNAQRARPDGTGLGLYMAQKVVVAQGGYIIFNSEEGKGSTFGFHFPKDMPEGQVTLPAQAPSGGLDG